MSSNAAVGGGGFAGEPKLKKRRTDCDGEDKFQHDGPVEDEETAREKMKEAGFDPDDVTKECALSESACEPIDYDGVGDMDQEGLWHTPKMHPMTYFCRIGDLKMCRYLLSKGASTTATSTCGWWFPMYAAARGGHLDVCKWLYDHGAKEDVRRSNGSFSSFSPLSAALSELSMDRKNTGRWFILKGVLSLDDKPGIVDPGLMRRDTRPRSYDERPQLLGWAKQSVETHSSFMTFLLGTLPAAVPTFSRAALRSLLAERLQSKITAEIFIRNAPEEQCRLAWQKIFQGRVSSPVVCLGGKIGMLELIADFVGVVRGRELRILRSVIGPLSEYLEEVPEGDPDPEDYGIPDEDDEDEE